MNPALILYNAVFNPNANQRHEKIAGFDMDDTLIKTKSGAKFAQSSDDWQWWHPCVPEKLRQIKSQGYIYSMFLFGFLDKF